MDWRMSNILLVFIGIVKLYYGFAESCHFPNQTTINPIVTKSDGEGLRIRFTYEGVRHRVKLILNSKLLSKLDVDDNKNNKLKECYYQGLRVGEKGDSPDFVTLSVCDGLRGVIQIHGHPHVIHPCDYQGNSSSSSFRPHTLVPLTEVRNRLPKKNERWCANQSGLWMPLDKLHHTEFRARISEKPPFRTKRAADAKYLELCVVLDKAMMKLLQNSEDYAMDFLLQITNRIDMYYQKLNIRIGMVYQQFWNESHMEFSSDPRQTLQAFLHYYQKNMTANKCDVIHFITGEAFDRGLYGIAVPDSVCTSRSVAVISLSAVDVMKASSVISHMIGHSIGLMHDSADCACPDIQYGCIMSNSINSKTPTQFSNCSITRAQMLDKAGFGSCLLNEPDVNSYPQACGNGFLERGEQCDCGNSNSCDLIDPCCEAKSCLLKSWAQCHSGACCKDCLPKKSQTVCRPAAGDCDAAEHCDGLQGECPPDLVIANGEMCLGDGSCYGGRCVSRDTQCAAYWGSGAKSAQMDCYSYNSLAGSFHGHCGVDVLGNYIKCDQKNVLCGLLQCDAGLLYPLNTQVRYMITSAGVSGSEEYKCKTINALDGEDINDVGLVWDGIKCGHGKYCLKQQCVDTPTIQFLDCPIGENNKTCSGRGRCTTGLTCACNHGYQGLLCDLSVPDDGSSYSSLTTTSVAPSAALETKWLILIVCATGAIVLIILLTVVFCRNHTKQIFFKKKDPKLKSILNDRSSDDGRQRKISFGQTPSYRNRKQDKKGLRKVKRHGRGKENHFMNSEEINEEIAIPKVLSRQPEKGILKNSSSTCGIQVDEEVCGSDCSYSEIGSSSSSYEASERKSEAADNTITVSVHNPAKDDLPAPAPPPPRGFGAALYSETEDVLENNEASPTESEEMQYCAAESDQCYGNYKPFERYNVPNHSTSQFQSDSATDSAIEMPGEGSVSTISELPPACNALSEYFEKSGDKTFYISQNNHSDVGLSNYPIHVYQVHNHMTPNNLSIYSDDSNHEKSLKHKSLSCSNSHQSTRNDLTSDAVSV